jgi:hypothetical protein
MVYHLTLESNSEQLSETERAVVEDAEARIVESVVLLSRKCPPEILPERAREQLLALRPHLEEAQEALEDLKGRRYLTDEELSQRYVFKMLLACRA